VEAVGNFGYCQDWAPQAQAAENFGYCQDWAPQAQAAENFGYCQELVAVAGRLLGEASSLRRRLILHLLTYKLSIK
jgi:hypothetical protein